MVTPRRLPWALVALLCFAGCKKKEDAAPAASGPSPSAPVEKSFSVGLVTDVGGRGDHSFNDSALRGLELWAAGKKMSRNGYVDVSEEELRASFPEDVTLRKPPIVRLPVTPLVLQ